MPSFGHSVRDAGEGDCLPHVGGYGLNPAFYLLRRCSWCDGGGAPFDPANPACYRADKPQNVVNGLKGWTQAWVRGARAGDWRESSVQNRFPGTLQKRVTGVVSVNLLCSMTECHVDRVTYAISA